MRSPRHPVPPTMSLAEAAGVLEIETALARRLADDGQFPVPVVGSGGTYRIPAAEVAVLRRVLRPVGLPAPWRTATVAVPDPTRPAAGATGRAAKEIRWPGHS